MFRILLFALLIVCVGSVERIRAQDVNEKARELVAALDKTKYKKKEKKDVRIEIYVDVKYEPVIKNNRSEYSGLYQSEEDDHSLDLRVASDGSVTGSGQDSGKTFSLKDAQIEGALLTATKVYEDGQTEKLEAVFSTRTVSQGRNPSEIATTDSRYGLGFIQTHGEWTNRVFMSSRR